MLDDALMRVSFLALIVAVAAVIMMVAVIFAAVVARSLFHVAIWDAITPTKVAMVAVAFLPSAWVMRTDNHIAVDLVRDRMPAVWADRMRGTALVVALAALIVMIWKTWDYAAAGLRLGEVIIGGDFNWPAFPIQVMIPIGLTIWALEVLRRIVLDLAKAGDRRLSDDGGEIVDGEIAA